VRKNKAMPTITTKTSNKALQAADNYINSCIIAPVVGYTWAQAMREAGYAESTIDSKSKETWGMVGVQQEIEAAKARLKRNSLNTVQKIRDKHEEFMALALEKGDYALARLNLQDLGRTYAAYTDKAVIDNEFTLNIQRFTKVIESNAVDRVSLCPAPDPITLDSGPGSPVSAEAGQTGAKVGLSHQSPSSASYEALTETGEQDDDEE
jgi:hypothetical protein